MKKRSIALILALVFLITLCPSAFAATSPVPAPSAPPTTNASGTHVHVWGRYHYIKEPTCIEEGERYTICEGCGERYDSVAPMKSHPFTAWNILKQAVGKEAGIRERVCTYCGLVERQYFYANGRTEPIGPDDPNSPAYDGANEAAGRDGTAEPAVQSPDVPEPDEPGTVEPEPNGTPDEPGTDEAEPNGAPDEPGTVDPSSGDLGPLDAPHQDEFVMLTKSVLTPPANGVYYAPGETVDYYIQLDNLGAAALLNLEIYDSLSTAPLLSLPMLDSYGTTSAHFTLTVTEADVPAGCIENHAEAFWTNSETNGAGWAQSNAVVIPVDMERTHEVSVSKFVSAVPVNGMFYAPGEIIHFTVVVWNTGNTVITEGRVNDPLYQGAGGSTELGTVELLQPNDTRVFYMDYVVSYDDAMNGGFTNYAYFDGVAEDGESVYGEDHVYIQAGVNWPAALLIKAEMSAPVNGQFYTVGEDIYYAVTVINVGNTDIIGLSVWDDDGWNPCILYDDSCNIQPGEFYNLSYSLKVTEDQAAQGSILNFADAIVYFANGDSTYCYDYVESPVGETLGTPSYTGGSAGEGDYCRRSLASASGDSLSATLDYCAEHAALAEQIAVNGETAETALALWLEAVNAEYDALAARGNEGFAALVETARESFAAWLETAGDELRTRCDDETLVNQLLAAKAQAQCAWLCYLNGAPVEQRPDSYLAAAIVPMTGRRSDNCASAQTLEGAHAEQEETLCTAHTVPERELLQALMNGADALASFRKAKMNWLTAMSEQLRADMSAGGDSAVTLERTAFGKLLAAEERLLQTICTEQPETVEELLMQRVRAHVLDRCAVLESSPAEEPAPTEEPVPTEEPAPAEEPAPVDEAQPAALNEELFGLWYLNSLDMGGSVFSAADFGMSITLELREDGSASMDTMGELAAGAWTSGEDGLTLSVEGEETAFHYADGALSAEEDGIVMFFTREQPQLSFAPAEAIEAADAAAFDGDWEAFQVAVGEVSVSVEALLAEGDMESLLGTDDLSLCVHGGAVSLFGQEAVEADFADGALSLASEPPISLRLLADGTLCLDVGGLCIYYAQK